MESHGGRRHLEHTRNLVIVNEAPTAEATAGAPDPDKVFYYSTGPTTALGGIKDVLALLPSNCLRSFW